MWALATNVTSVLLITIARQSLKSCMVYWTEWCSCWRFPLAEMMATTSRQIQVRCINVWRYKYNCRNLPSTLELRENKVKIFIFIINVLRVCVERKISPFSFDIHSYKFISIPKNIWQNKENIKKAFYRNNPQILYQIK